MGFEKLVCKPVLKVVLRHQTRLVRESHAEPLVNATGRFIGLFSSALTAVSCPLTAGVTGDAAETAERKGNQLHLYAIQR